MITNRKKAREGENVTEQQQQQQQQESSKTITSTATTNVHESNNVITRIRNTNNNNNNPTNLQLRHIVSFGFVLVMISCAFVLDFSGLNNYTLSPIPLEPQVNKHQNNNTNNHSSSNNKNDTKSSVSSTERVYSPIVYDKINDDDDNDNIWKDILDYQSIKGWNQSRLDFLEWEMIPPIKQKCPWDQSPNKNDKNRIPKYCCIGSHSGGGPVKYVYDHFCVKNKQQENYIHATNTTMDFLTDRYPLSLLTNKQKKQQEQSSSSSSSSFPVLMECDVCRIVQHLMTHNMTLGIVGDSVTTQTVYGIDCELRRRGFIVERTTQQGTGEGKYGITMETQMIVSLPTTTTTTASMAPRRAALIRTYRAYRVQLSEQEPQRIANENDIVMFDHGLHYLPKLEDLFINETIQTLNAYQTGKQLKLLLWRETSAQHCNTTTGDFEDMKKTNSQIVVPLKHNATQSIRTKWMQQACQQTNNDMTFYTLKDYISSSSKTTNINNIATGTRNKNDDDNDRIPMVNELVMLPFYEYSRLMFQMHNMECTHFCHTPDIWLPIFRYLRLAMDTKFGF